MKRNSFIRINIASVVVVIALLAGVMVGCQEEVDEPLNDSIINSLELEEYIIAVSDFKQSLAIFEKELSNVDFSKLEVTYDPNGKKVIHLPSSVISIGIGGKLDAFNEKKTALLNKFPQFASFREDTGKKYFQQCIQNSARVKGKLSDLGINISQPRLKSGTEYWYGEDQALMMSYLYNWANNSNYVELYIIMYADGTFATYQDPDATYNKAGEISYTTTINGNMYIPEIGYSCNVIAIGHTHIHSPNPTKPDANGANDYFQVPSGVSRFIYYDWGFYYY
jgi:hypothetical protein